MEHRSGSGVPNLDQIAELRARADAGDRNAAGRLGEVLAKHGDLEGAVQVWSFSDAVWHNPAGLHAEFLDTLDTCERLEREDDPEDWAFMEAEQLARLLAERGDEAAIAELRARADAGDLAAAKRLAG